MYCSNCGKELQNGESFCSNCGTKAGAIKSGGFDFSKAENIQKAIEQIKDRLNGLGDHKKAYLSSICLLIISAFLVTKEMFQVSYTVFYTNTSTYTMFEDNEVLGTLFVLAFLAAAVAMLLPLLLNREWKTSDFALGKYVPLASLVWLFIVIIVAINKVSDEMGEYQGLLDAVDLSFKFTSNAWFFMIISVCAALFAFIAAKVISSEEVSEAKFKPFIDRY